MPIKFTLPTKYQFHSEYPPEIRSKISKEWHDKIKSMIWSEQRRDIRQVDILKDIMGDKDTRERQKLRYALPPIPPRLYYMIENKAHNLSGEANMDKILKSVYPYLENLEIEILEHIRRGREFRTIRNMIGIEQHKINNMQKKAHKIYNNLRNLLKDSEGRKKKYLEAV